MATVRLSFSPEPAHVRTARLVGVAVARRAGIGGDLLDEVRLAIGEACSRAVALHKRHGLRAPILVEMTDGPGYEVRVIDQAPQDVTPGPGVPGLSGAVPELSGTVPELTGTVTELIGPASARGAPAGEASADLAGGWTGMGEVSPQPTGSPAMEAIGFAPDGLSEEAVAAGMGLALLASLVDDLEVRRVTGGAGTAVRMVWLPRSGR